MKKIMFNDKYGLTKAVLEGRKTQTRRIAHITQHQFELLTGVHPKAPKELIQSILDTTSRFKVGEIVAVAQSMCDVYAEYDMKCSGKDTKDLMKKFGGSACFNNKMFVKASEMPHQIRITNVRIQRLQDISYEDCIKEGIRKDVRYSFIENVKQSDGDNLAFSCNFNSPREAYAALIEKVSGKGTWEINPYVFVYDFELVK
jgi:hypothetical protein